MEQWLLTHQNDLRLGSFLGLLMLFGLLEAMAPRRERMLTRFYRWGHNLALVALNTAVLRFTLPVLAVGMAAIAQEENIGLFNWLALPGLFELIAAIVLMDLAIYGQHVAIHKIPFLWRLHRVHHTDLDFDVTTGLRFHPLEIIFSMLVKFGIVFAVGASPVAVLIFEVLLNAGSLFNHSNLRLPTALDAVLRKVIVTPDFHRVHHSTIRHEQDSNYGFFLPWWDYIFRTYNAQPERGHEDMDVGQPNFRHPLDQNVFFLLLQPMARGGQPVEPKQE